jgi:uncharacterized membrane protein YfhO
VKDEPDEIVLETDVGFPGYLVLADTYYPGWRATIDGAATRIFPADIAFRAVKLPPGKHTVRFVYRPMSVGVGFLVAGLALLISCFMVWRRGERLSPGLDPQARI